MDVLTASYRAASRNLVIASAVSLLARFASLTATKLEKFGFELDFTKSGVSLHAVLFVILLYFGYRFFFEVFGIDEKTRSSDLRFKIDYWFALLLFAAAAIVAGVDYAESAWRALGGFPISTFWKVALLGISWGVVVEVVRTPFLRRPYDPRPVPLFAYTLVVFIAVLAIAVGLLRNFQFSFGWLAVVIVTSKLGLIYVRLREGFYRHARWYQSR